MEASKLRCRGSATRTLFEEWLRDIGASLGRTIELSYPEAVRSLVSAGIGVGYMSRLAVAEEIRRKRLKVLPVTGLPLTRTIYLIRHADKRISPPMKAFLEMVRSSVKGA